MLAVTRSHVPIEHRPARTGEVPNRAHRSCARVLGYDPTPLDGCAAVEWFSSR
jgi:hypothetical protein